MNQHPKQIEAFEMAKSHLGLREIVGPKHNQQIIEFFRDVGHSWVKDDETAWCAAFVGAMLERCGLPSTKKLNARGYLDWGEEVQLADAEPGDVVVFWRGKPTAATGHVAFLVEVRSHDLLVLGGNQSNSVNIQGYPKERLLGVRRYPGPVVEEKQATPAPASGIFALINWLGGLFNARRG